MRETINRLVQLNTALLVAVVALVVLGLLGLAVAFGWTTLLGLVGITSPTVIVISLSLVMIAGLLYFFYHYMVTV